MECRGSRLGLSTRAWPVLAAALWLMAGTAQAQRAVPLDNGIPVAPTGLQGQPLGAGPFTYQTAEGQHIRVTVLARMPWPYALAFLPNGDLLVTQRGGELRLIARGTTEAQPVPGGPPSVFLSSSGMLNSVHGYMGLAVHPRFAQNNLLYLAYTQPLPDGGHRPAVARARLDGARLVDLRDVWVGEGLTGAIGLAMTPDARLWIGTPGYFEDSAQEPGSLAGKVLRFEDDGSVPPDNPFVGRPGWQPGIYTLGHRAALGFTVHPASGDVYLSEMGPNGGDEINLLRAGRNYGWPAVSLGRTYPGPWQAATNEPTHAGYEPPVIYWMPSISVAGLTFYTGERLPQWRGDLFVSGLRLGEVPGTGRLDRVVLNEQMEELRRETLLADLRQRIRDVKQGPDGLLYVVIDEEQGAILRIEPAR